MSKPAPLLAQTPVRPATFLWLGALFALGVALTEVLYHIAERYFGWRWYVRLSPDFVWMTAVIDLVLFAVPALVFFGLAHVVRPRFCLPIGIFVMSWLFFVNPLLLYGQLHPLATIMLTTGLAMQTSRFLWRRWPQAQPKLLRGLTLTVGLLIVLSVGRHVAVSKERASGEANQPAAAGAPNVIIITMDTVRARSMSLYGYERDTTPHLKEWASKGACFGNALTTAPWTLPSHASMFTGRYPHELTAHWRMPLDDTHSTLAEVLRDKGYRTGGFVANRYYAGFDSGLARGFATYEDYNRSPGEFVNCSALSRWLFNRRAVRDLIDFHDLYGLKTGADVNDSFWGWLSGKEDKPFFAFINYFDAHDPYLPPAPFDSKFGPSPTTEERTTLIEWWHHKPQELPPERIDMVVRCYDGSIAYVDQQVHNLLEGLERRGLLNNTLVIITSDHGEHFGEHGRFIHGNSLYRELLHVPLVMLFPQRIPANTSVPDCVTLRDLPATVLTLLGDDDAKLPGYSLSRFWDAALPTKPESPPFQLAFAIPPQYGRPEHGRSPAATGFIVSLFDNGKYYIRYETEGREELYDFDGDPRQETDLTTLPENAAVLASFRKKVDTLFRSLPGPYRDLPPPVTASSPVDWGNLLAWRCCRE